METYATNLMEKFIKEMNNMNEQTQVTNSVESQQLDGQLKWATPEAYRQDTGHRFRLSKEEIAAGLTRQAAFEARQRAGKLS